jgi:hypothetical protein
MCKAHPILYGDWLAICSILYNEGEQTRASLKARCKLSNHELRTHFRLLLMREMLRAEGGRYSLTDFGTQRVEQTLAELRNQGKIGIRSWLFNSSELSA